MTSSSSRASPLRLSIAMATYNGAEYLAEQLGSLAAQERLPDELVVCDDGSSDATLRVLGDFAATAPFPVRVEVNSPRLGVNANFEKAARLCSGDIVFLCDQDDVWYPDKLEQVERLFAHFPETMVVLNDAALVSETLEDSGLTQLGSVRRSGYGDSAFNFGCCSAHRKAWQDIVFPIPAEADYHDKWINGLAHSMGAAFVTDRTLQAYRRHGDNVTQWILSDPAGATRWRILLDAGLKDGKVNWRKNLVILDLMLDRLEQRRAVLAQLLPSADLSALTSQLRGTRRRLEQRIALCSLPRYRRFVPIARHWIGNGYAASSGWKSAVKDLLRP
jgi:glycosyltransferase involved in cell wall biosynthesis